MNRYTLKAVILAFTLVALCSYGVTTNYWDNNGDTAGFGTAGGTWGVDGNWSSDSTGGSTPAVTNTTTADILNFGTAADGLAAGTITVDGTSQAFKTMAFGAASGEITLTGGTLNLAAPVSTVTVNNSSNTIGSVLAGTNGLQKGSPGPLTYTSFLTSSPVTIFPNKTLSDYVSANGVMDGGWVSRLPADGYFFSNDGTTATYQLQVLDGGYTKCVGIELTQVGNDIAARARYARYVSGSQLGFDFDTGGNNGTIATSSGANGYGAAETAITANRTLMLTGVNTYSGSTIIDGGTLEIGGGGQLGSGAYTGAIFNAGQFLYNSASNQTLSGSISGQGSIVKRGAVKTPSLLVYNTYLPATPSSAIIFPNTTLADCIGADGRLGGTSITGGSTSGEAYFFTNDGTTATWQLQTINDTPWTKCVKVELTQVGNDIAARVLYAKYINNGSVLGYDFDTGGNINTIATSGTAGGYGAAQTTLVINRYPTLTLSGVNSYTGGTVIDGGTLEVNGSTSSLPTSGGITVNEGAELLLNVPGDPGIQASVGGNNPIYVNGGLLTINGKFNAGHSRPISVDGGIINSTVTANGDNSNYMNNLTLINGASITGYQIRVGYVSVPTITVSGTSPSSIPAGITMVKNGTQPLTINVADVTGDDIADLTISGVIRDYPQDNLRNMPMVKTGTGTLSLSGQNTHIGVININEGTLTLDGADSLNTGNPVVLNGGTLDMGDYANTCGTLTVSGTSTLLPGAGTVAFADSSALTWSGTLTITGALGEQSIRFGTDDTALTSLQLDAISLNGGRALLSADGYLMPPPEGTIILIQ